MQITQKISQYAMALAVLVLLTGTAVADVVYYQSGGSLKGLVVEEHHDRIVISTEEGERTILRDDIDEIFYAEPERNHLYLGQQALEFGEWGLARGFFRKALQINPRFAEAEDALSFLDDQEKKQQWANLPRKAVDFLRDAWGLGLEQGSDYVQIVRVLPGSIAEQKGLKVGDALVAVWSNSLRFLDVPTVADILVGPKKTSLKLTIERQVVLPKASGRGDWPCLKLSMERLGATIVQVSCPPAELAGCAPQDRIVTVGNEQTRYLSLREISKAIKAQKEQGITLLIQRDLIFERE